MAYLRENVTDIYPEGTSWRPLWENVTDVSVNDMDEVQEIYFSFCPFHLQMSFEFLKGAF